MPATAGDLANSIEPGSTEYGDRQVLEQGLAAAVPGNAGGPDPAAAAPPAPVDGLGDPLGALLGGSVDPQGGGAITDGLSVGPGTGPGGVSQQQDPRLTRLQQLAQHAKSPLLRASARNELRRLTGTRV